MPDRYFVDEPISANRVTLAGPEAHHLIHVMRATAGTRVTLFDGGGDEFSAAIERVGRSEVELSIVSRESIDRELPFDLTLGVALPKGDRQKWLVEKAVELGMTRIVPLRTQRGVAQPVEQALVRLRRAVIEASKQCGRNRLLQIEEPRAWPDFVANTGTVPTSVSAKMGLSPLVPQAAGTPCRLVAHPGGEKHLCSFLADDSGNTLQAADSVAPLRRSSAGCNQPPSTACKQAVAQGDVCLAIGPEGGFAEDEIALAVAAGWRTIDLGPRILRVETAALCLAAVIASARCT